MTLTILYYLKNNIYIFIVQSFSDDVFYSSHHGSLYEFRLFKH